MNTKSKLLNPINEIRDLIRMSNGAWSFCLTLLWPGQRLADEELDAAKAFICAHIENAYDRSKAFTDFCQRNILMRNYLKSKDIAIPQPSCWFDPEHSRGFYASKEMLNRVNAKRKQIPKYLQHYIIAAIWYRRLVLMPTNKVFIACYQRLLSLHAPALLQQYLNSILHFNYKNQ